MALCSVFAKVADRHPRARLVLVGDTGAPYRGVALAVERLGMGERIAVCPVTPNIYEWYTVADGFVLASEIESLPRTILEAMAFEVPVLASAVFGVPELVRDGIDGVLFEPRCLASLETALDGFFSLAPGERRELGRRGAARVSPSRDSRRYAAEYRALVTGCLRP